MWLHCCFKFYYQSMPTLVSVLIHPQGTFQQEPGGEPLSQRSETNSFSLKWDLNFFSQKHEFPCAGTVSFEVVNKFALRKLRCALHDHLSLKVRCRVMWSHRLCLPVLGAINSSFTVVEHTIVCSLTGQVCTYSCTFVKYCWQACQHSTHLLKYCTEIRGSCFHLICNIHLLHYLLDTYAVHHLIDNITSYRQRSNISPDMIKYGRHVRLTCSPSLQRMSFQITTWNSFLLCRRWRE